MHTTSQVCVYSDKPDGDQSCNPLLEHLPSLPEAWVQPQYCKSK
jgi:hypothetical protein